MEEGTVCLIDLESKLRVRNTSGYGDRETLEQTHPEQLEW